MPYDDGFNTWFHENGKKVFIGPRIEFKSKGSKIQVTVTENSEDAAKAKAAGYEHVLTTLEVR